MTQTVALPLWLVVILVTLATWAGLVLLFAPGMRWIFRSRLNRLIGQINARLSIELPPFKLTRRQVLIDRLFHDEKVQAAASDHAKHSGESLTETWRRIDRYAREIVPSFNAYFYFRVGYAVARSVARLLYRVRIGYADEAALARIHPKSTLVFVMNHRSNMDYVLVAFLAAERVTLSYAVGEWARIWPLQQLIRAMGAFFVRRNSGDELYRTVLARYVHMATAAGVTQAMFPEGGLTIDGRLRPPKYGLLDYMSKNFDDRDGDERRDIVFIPVGINYDRVLEDRSQLMKLQSEQQKPGRMRALLTTLGFGVHNLWLALQGHWYRFGYACVNFGTPLSLRAWCREHSVHFPNLSDADRHAQVVRLTERLMQEIGAVVPVLPVSLLAGLLVEAPGRAWTELDLKAAAHARIGKLEERGAHIYIPRQDLDYAFTVGLRILVLRHLVTENEGLFATVPAAGPLLVYYANAIEHFGQATS